MLRTIEPVGSPPSSPRSRRRVRPRRSRGRDTSPLSKRLATSLAVPHVSRAHTAALVVRPPDRHDGLLQARRALARAGLEREARRHVRGARRARAGVPDPRPTSSAVASRTARPGRAPPARGPRRPDALDAGPLAARRQVRAAGIVRVTGASSATSRSSTPAHRAGLERGSTIRVAAALGAVVDRAVPGHGPADPALAAALSFRDALRRAGVVVPAAPLGGDRGDGAARVRRSQRRSRRCSG